MRRIVRRTLSHATRPQHRLLAGAFLHLTRSRFDPQDADEIISDGREQKHHLPLGSVLRDNPKDEELNEGSTE
ncbi:hypothetical protein BraRD5C2_67990 [Bradyrhizobium sp. RD5-C2]|nr:hypothetical protein BraRD5C2_67990 [Bradyrhizobium sp. RD5-C2]